MSTPIIPGFHPDPSICRVGDTYYIATSSFEYSPGVPIHRSADLLHWELVGNALDRDSQLRPSAGAKDSGIYAPTLRHHDGRFWLTTTDTSRPFDGQLIVHAASAEGPWSEPAFVPAAVGIDPDLVWDEEGTAHLSWRSFHPDLDGIASLPIDPMTGEARGEARLLWAGTGLPHIEAPHLYRIDGWWYLMVAEGGTERGHVVSIARSRTIHGEYEACPANPILTHRSTAHPVQNTGHADLVENPDGSWSVVYLGVRPRGKTPAFHVNGRETFLAGVDWVDGWPRIDEGRYAVPATDHSFTDDLTAASLHPRWIAPGALATSFTATGERGALLTYSAERLSPSILATRALDGLWSAEIELEDIDGHVRVLVRHDDTHWYGVDLVADGAESTLAIGPAVAHPRRAAVDARGRVTVGIRVRHRPAPQPYGANPEPDMVGFTVRSGDGETVDLGEYDGRYLSTEVAGGFTGRVWGIEILGGTARVTAVRYASHPGDEA
ncbi:glycoside hydrolase family 43 protein [Microbacterium sp. NPDC089320]|uniref:glycoside hydrolase family 43 protein n=1 Tax=Microbacterium sp. NPDC089320 TaxID=3155182 RepID=UPI00342A2E62